MTHHLQGAVSALVVVFLLAGMGCSSLETYEFDQHPQSQAWKTHRAMPLKAAVLPLVVSYSQESDLEKNAGEYNVPLNKKKFLQEQVEVLQEYPIFREWKVVKGDKKEMVDHVNQAWRDKMDVLVRMEIKKYRFQYRGASTGTYIFNLFTWFYAWVPSWWVADEQYRGEMEGTIEVYSVHSGKKLWEEEVTVSREDYLNDWDRGWKLFGIFTVPGWLTVSNYETVRESMAPWLEKKFQADLVNAFQTKFRRYVESPQSDYREKTKKTLALMVGLSRYGNALGDRTNALYGYKDAKALRDFLNPRIRKTQLVVDEKATSENVRKVINDFLRTRCHSEDTVIFYFSGYGAGVKKKDGINKLYLLTNETNYEEVDSTALEVNSLLDELATVPARQRWVILDTSFGGKLEGKSMTSEWNRNATALGEKAITQKEIGQLYQRLKNRGGKTFLLLSCDPHQGALQLTYTKRSLFNFYLIRGMSHLVAQRKTEEAVEFSRLYQYLNRKVWAQARRRGRHPQNVVKFAPLKSGKKGTKREAKSLLFLGESPLVTPPPNPNQT